MYAPIIPLHSAKQRARPVLDLLVNTYLIK